MFETQIVDCQSTAFFMQYLAVLAAKKNVPTVLTDVAQRYKSTKWAFINILSTYSSLEEQIIFPTHTKPSAITFCQGGEIICLFVK